MNATVNTIGPPTRVSIVDTLAAGCAIAFTMILGITAGMLTTFIRNGFQRVAMLLRTGHIDRPDVLIAAPAACVMGGLVLFSLWGYWRIRNKSWSDLLLLAAIFAMVLAFFIAISAAFAPQYLDMFKHLFSR